MIGGTARAGWGKRRVIHPLKKNGVDRTEQRRRGSDRDASVLGFGARKRAGRGVPHKTR